MKRSIVTVGITMAVGLIVSAGVLAAGKPAPTRDGRAAVQAPAASVAEAEMKKGRDGAACSDGDECRSGTCEGGSCCTAAANACNSSSHCCGHVSCDIPQGESTGTCP